jgi:DHA1 family bicyclomycin/chloramphenicol resistance-like MFS transporter
LHIAPKSFAFTVVLGVLAALPALSIDISAPTLALLPQALGTSAILASMTLTLFMVGFALGQFGGSLSDRLGRRPVLLTGLACYTLAGIACTMSESGGSLAVFRLIQGAGAGACSVLAFTMVQDLFEGNAARSKRSYVTVIFGAVPILAPALGSALTHLAGWRSVHGVLAIAGGALLMVAWFGVAESRPILPGPATPTDRNDRRLRDGRLRDDPGFIGIALANALSYGVIFAYIAGSPIVIIGQMGFSSGIFAATFACTAMALIVGAWTGGRLSRRNVPAASLLDPSLSVAAAATVTLTAISLSGITSGVILMPLLLVTMFTRGIIAPNLQHLAIERQRQRAGAASAAVGVSQILSGALASGAVAVLLPLLGPSAVAVPMAVFAAAAGAAWLWSRRWSNLPV